ncbi:MAG: hypothetical protein WA001_00990 [Patescibacteria group bacterium]
MNNFEIIPSDKGVTIKATGSTRAGLMVAAVKGATAAMDAVATDESSKEIERAFSLSTAAFAGLVTAVVSAVLASSAEHHEAYHDVKFSLITDKQANGAFIGRAANVKEPLKLADQAIEPKKNGEGMWEAEIVLTA